MTTTVFDYQTRLEDVLFLRHAKSQYNEVE
jgi:hypothetical protein